MFSRFFSRKPPKSSLDAITFDASRYTVGREVDGCRTWFTPEGDGLGLYFFPTVPDLPRRVESAAALREFYLARYGGQALRVVEAEWIAIEGVRSVWTLMKVPQKPTGMTYLASITLPFAEFSFVLKLQCAEHGITGMREAALAMKAADEGRVTLGPDGIVGEWDPDAPAHDADFPGHPVSRARREFALLQPTVRIDAPTRAQKRFYE